MTRGSTAAIQADLTKFVKDATGDEIKHVAGQAAKKAANDVAERDFGGDRVLSGFGRRNARLDAGYDLAAGARVTLNLRPKGLWMLANDGRRPGPGRVHTKKRNGANALNTPWGPRANVSASRWGGKGTLADAEKAIEVETFKAVDRAITEAIRSI